MSPVRKSPQKLNEKSKSHASAVIVHQDAAAAACPSRTRCGQRSVEVKESAALSRPARIPPRHGRGRRDQIGDIDVQRVRERHESAKAWRRGGVLDLLQVAERDINCFRKLCLCPAAILAQPSVGMTSASAAAVVAIAGPTLCPVADASVPPTRASTPVSAEVRGSERSRRRPAQSAASSNVAAAA